MPCEAKHGQWGGWGGGWRSDEPLLEFGSVGSVRLGSRCGWVPFSHFSSPFLFKYCDSRTQSRTVSETSKWLSRLSILLQKSVFWLEGGWGGRDVKGQHPLSIQGAASAVKGQHLCVWWWGLHQQLRHWEDLSHGGGGGGGHQKQHNTRMRCLSKCKVASSVKNGHVPSFPVSE